ncbi:copper homeostasis protein CutC [Lentibacillus populi]|uniref:PF03932 family protein CutC n=1 Tax=Lentibacillus populi TaxID=1827502 RepID=A0A9W5U0E0_9BACI|nr:copper homeostasis protein CutC [Lentibacillus populi]GGB55194.1 copper homeostasis protein CutC [Lentibacillus populi]
MKIEIITLNAADTRQAAAFGADRVELVSAIHEGGLTPSYGTIKNVLSTSAIPVQIMIRPHSHGFVYDETDWKTMKEDISMIRTLGGNRIVFGCITDDGQIDEHLLNKVLEHAPDFDVTFHRAFDSLRSQLDGYRVLHKYKKNIKRILTSGGKPKAKDATLELKQLVALSNELEGPIILAGSGISSDNIGSIHKQIGTSEYHIGSGARLDGDFSKGIDRNKMDHIRRELAI